MTRQSGTNETPREIRARYARSNFARVIHVDGAFGGLTNSLQVHMAVYSEHRAITENLLLSAGPDGTVKETPLEQEGDPLFIRETEADLLLTPNAARAIVKWLQDRIAELDVAVEQIREAEARAKRGGGE